MNVVLPLALPHQRARIRGACMANRILRIDTVLDRTGLTRRTLYAEISAGRFPRSISITSRCVGWSEDAVQAWIDAKIAAAEGRSA